MSLEMLLDVEIFKNTGPIKEATLVPLVFPLLAGAGAFTTLLSLRAEYASINIIIALILNMRTSFQKSDHNQKYLDKYRGKQKSRFQEKELFTNQIFGFRNNNLATMQFYKPILLHFI